MLSPRLATYKARPGGASVVRAGSGVLATAGVEGLEVSTNFGATVWAQAAGVDAAAKPKEMNRILAKEVDMALK